MINFVGIRFHKETCNIKPNGGEGRICQTRKTLFIKIIAILFCLIALDFIIFSDLVFQSYAVYIVRVEQSNSISNYFLIKFLFKIN